MALSLAKQDLLARIALLNIPASTTEEEVPGEGTYVHLVVDCEKFDLPKRLLGSLWKEGYLNIKDGLLVGPTQKP